MGKKLLLTLFHLFFESIVLLLLHSFSYAVILHDLMDFVMHIVVLYSAFCVSSTDFIIVIILRFK
jgi:hypothetical protein